MRNFAIMSGQQRLGGNTLQAAYGANNTHADQNSIRLSVLDPPSASVRLNSRGFGRGPFLSEPPFERSEFSQACIDVTAVIFCAFFIASVVASLPLAIVLM